MGLLFARSTFVSKKASYRNQDEDQGTELYCAARDKSWLAIVFFLSAVAFGTSTLAALSIMVSLLSAFFSVANYQVEKSVLSLIFSGAV